MIRLFTDMTGRTIQLDTPPSRIISLVPSQTELLFDLGLGDEVVGITKFCVHPDEWFRNKRRVGGTKHLDIETIRTLKPDLILCNKEENEKEQIELLAATYPVWVSDIKDLADALVMIRNVSIMTVTMNAAMAIEKEIKGGFADLKKSHAALKVLYLIWKDPYMTAGGDTFISDMISRAGWHNIMAARERYPSLTEDELRVLQPDVVFLSSEPFPFGEKHLPELQQLMPASKIILVDGEMFSWYGSRIRRAVRYLKELIPKVENLVP